MRISFLFGAGLLVLAVAFAVAEQEPMSQSPATLTGIVVDAQGNPVAGAIIMIDQEMPMGGIEEIDNSDALWEEYESAADGTFRIPGLRHGGRYDVTVRHPRYVAGSLWGVEAPTAEPVRIVLRPGRSIMGKVVGPEGEPVAGAMLSLIEERSMAGAGGRSGHSIAQTDQEGRFQAHGLPPGLLTLEVEAMGYRSKQVDNIHLPDHQDINDLKIALERGAQLEILVLNARGEPVELASVYLDSNASEEVRSPFDSNCDTDSQGRCRITVPGAGLYKVRVSTSRLHGTGITANVKSSGGITPVEIRLPAGVEISGRVLGEDGAPIEKAEIMLFSGENGTGWPVGKDGSFRFSDVVDGKYRLTAKRSNTSDASAAVLEIEVAGQPLRDLELRLPKDDRVVLTGRVLGLESGDSQHIVLTAQPEPNPNHEGRFGQVNAKGEYKIRDLGPGDWMVFAQTLTGRVTSATVRIEPGSSTASLDLQFPPRGPRLSGRILVNGSPMPEIGIQARRNLEVVGQSGTIQDGTFKLDLREPGAITLLVGGPQGIGASRPLQVTDDSEITVEIRTSRLRGTVLGPTGEPVKDATITIQGWSPETGLPLWEIKIRGGSFEVPRVATGTVRISVQAPGLAETETMAEVPPGEERAVEIRLGSAAKP